MAMTSIQENLLETLEDLSYEELLKFKHVLQYTKMKEGLPRILRHQMETDDTVEIVKLMVENYGPRSVEVTREVFKDMSWRDLMTSLGFKEVYTKLEPALFDRDVVMALLQEYLLDTLKDLGDGELEKFKHVLQYTKMKDDLPRIPRHLLETADRFETVKLMVENYGQLFVEVTSEVLKEMNWSDLKSRPGSKEVTRKLGSALSDRDVTMTSLQEEPLELLQEDLLEALEDLSNGELEKFKHVLQYTKMKGFPGIPRHLMETADIVQTVELMVENYGQQSVEVTREVLKKMNRSDLVQRLSDISSGSKGPSRSLKLEACGSMMDVTVTSLQDNILETLKDLSYGELEKFKHVLQYTKMKKGFPRIPRHLMETADRVQIVKLMVEYYGQQSVEVTREVLKEINRKDLVLPGFKPKTGKLEPALSKRDVTMTSLQENLLETLKDLSDGELEKFKHVLQYTKMKEDLPRIPGHLMETTDIVQTVELMVENYGQQSVEVTREVLKKMNRSDLVQRLSDISSGSKGPSGSLKLEACGSMMQDSSDWTKLEPEVSRTDAEEAPTYSLQSEAGNFECSVSRLRWVCQERVSFTYWFCSWEEPMERMESINYMPAGPLMDIKIIAGKVDEVYLPHWICIDDDPEILDRFAVLHISDCGDVVEQVSEVTPSHVKLSQPVFSPRAVLLLMKAGAPVKINCNVMIYKTNTAFLTLHVYLIPDDPGLQQAMDKRQLSKGYTKFDKPDPDKSLKMHDRFILTADLGGAEIYPEELKLRYKSRNPNFFEVYIKNPDKDLKLNLAQRKEHQPVWTCAIRKDEYQSTAHKQEEHSVDEHLSTQMQAASISTDRERLFEMLEDLKQEEFKKFKWFLQDSDFLAGLPCIPRSQLEKADMSDLVDLMLNTYSQQSVEVTKSVFKKINRNDLVQRL